MGTFLRHFIAKRGHFVHVIFFTFSLFQAALLSRFRPPNDDNGAFQMIAFSVICLIVILMGFVFVLRTIGKFAFSPFWNSSDTSL